jgi:hypothetical protein
MAIPSWSILQEKENLIGIAMTNVRKGFERFRSLHKRDDEEVIFAVIGGDFNCDNMSPGSPLTFTVVVFFSLREFFAVNFR